MTFVFILSSNPLYSFLIWVKTMFVGSHLYAIYVLSFSVVFKLFTSSINQGVVAHFVILLVYSGAWWSSADVSFLLNTSTTSSRLLVGISSMPTSLVNWSRSMSFRLHVCIVILMMLVFDTDNVMWTAQWSEINGPDVHFIIFASLLFQSRLDLVCFYCNGCQSWYVVENQVPS